MSKKAIIPSVTVLIASAAPALAHPGHGFAFTDGLTHPIGGIDHLLAMVAVGFRATVMGPRAMIALPSTFVVSMVIGALAAYAGGPALPATELMIVFSLLLLGVAIIVRAVPPLWLASVLTALFALAHGQAHGVEVPLDADIRVFVAGFAVSTALLHALGLLLASSTRHHQWTAPAFGTVLAITATAILAA